MAWKDLMPKCFGDRDLIFGLDASDATNAHTMLKEAINAHATMSEVLTEAESYLRSKGALESHISEQLRKIKALNF